jgi:hypothetical protein
MRSPTGEMIPQPSDATALVGWSLIMAVTAAIFLGTLMLKPKRES